MDQVEDQRFCINFSWKCYSTAMWLNVHLWYSTSPVGSQDNAIEETKLTYEPLIRARETVAQQALTILKERHSEVCNVPEKACCTPSWGQSAQDSKSNISNVLLHIQDHLEARTLASIHLTVTVSFLSAAYFLPAFETWAGKESSWKQS